MRKKFLVLGSALCLLWSCQKEDIGTPAGDSVQNGVSAVSEPDGPQAEEYTIPEEEAVAAGSVASFEDLMQSYYSGELTREGALSVNLAYAEWVMEASFNKAHAHLEEGEYYSEPEAAAVSIEIPLTTLEEKVYVNGYDLAAGYVELEAMAGEAGFEIAPNSDLEIVSVEGDVMIVSLAISKKWFNFYGPVPLGPDDDYKAYVKTKCDNSGNMNAAQRLTKAHRSFTDLMAYPWYYDVKTYYIENNKLSTPYIRDIYDYRLYYNAYDPFGRLGKYHRFNVSKTSFDDRFLGGESVSGVSNATQYAPGYCVDDTEMVSLNNDLKYVLDEVRKDIPEVSSIKVWSDRQFNYNSMSSRTHHNLQFRGAFAMRVAEPSFEKYNPILLY